MALIAVDFDDVIFPFNREIIKAFNTRYAADIDHIEVHVHGDYMLPHFDGMDHQSVIEEFVRSHSPDITPLPGAKEALASLAQDHTVVIMTARPAESEAVTRAWVERNLSGVISDVYLLGNEYEGGFQTPVTKGEKCIEIGAAVLIDDFPKYALSAHDRGVEVVLFGDYEWNEKIRGTLRHAADWDAAERIVRELL